MKTDAAAGAAGVFGIGNNNDSVPNIVRRSAATTIFPLHPDLRVRAPWVTLDMAAEALVQALFLALFANSALLIVLKGFTPREYDAAVESMVQMIVNVFELAVGFTRCNGATTVQQILSRWTDLGRPDAAGRRERRFGQVLCLDSLQYMGPEAHIELAQVLFVRDQLVVPSSCNILSSAFGLVAFVDNEQMLRHPLREKFLLHVALTPPCPSFPSTQLISGGSIVYSFNKEIFDDLMCEYDVTHTDRDILSFIRDIVVNLRTHPLVGGGLTARTVVALETCVKGVAVLSGQKFVIPTHVQAIAISVLAHRIELFPDANPNDTSMLADIVDAVISNMIPPK